MTLPAVSGWMIDFRSARSIFESGNNHQISHCVEACSNGTFRYSHREHELFKEDAALKAAFVDQQCRCFPDQQVLQAALGIRNSPLAKKMLAGSRDGGIFIAAIASTRNYGVISDHRSLVFPTVFDLCKHYGIPVLSTAEYFDAI